jgi:hypothetical protein
LHRGPWKSRPSYKNTLGSHIRPLKDSRPCNAALGAVAGAGGAIPVSSGGGVGRGSCREGLGCATGLFGPGLGVELAGGGARGGARWWHPLRLEFWRGVRQGGAVRGGGSSVGC